MFNPAHDQPPVFLGGVALYVLPDTPRMQLSPECPVTEDFRAEMNAWMVDFFGTTNVLRDGHIYIDMGTKRHYCNPRTLAALQSAEKVASQVQQQRAQAAAQKAKQPPAPIKQRHNKYRKQMPRRK